MKMNEEVEGKAISSPAFTAVILDWLPWLPAFNIQPEKIEVHCL